MAPNIRTVNFFFKNVMLCKFLRTLAESYPKNQPFTKKSVLEHGS